MSKKYMGQTVAAKKSPEAPAPTSAPEKKTTTKRKK